MIAARIYWQIVMLLSCFLCMGHVFESNTPPPQSLQRLARQGYAYAKQHHHIHDPIMIIVDFTQPSDQKRLWVYNIESNRTLFQTYVSHGMASGMRTTKRFSNAPGSHASSIGFFKTGSAYLGQHGLSMSLNGLERHFNDHAAQRGIIVHPASYMRPSFIASHHRSGRSWGCFALNPEVSHDIIDITKNGHLLFAYGLNKDWQHHSKFIRPSPFFHV